MGDEVCTALSFQDYYTIQFGSQPKDLDEDLLKGIVGEEKKDEHEVQVVGELHLELTVHDEDSARSREGGYSLEALTKDPRVMDGAVAESEVELITAKESMKAIFGKKKIKKDGTEGKVITLAPVEELQRTERMSWVCYSAQDSISTLSL